MNRFDDFERDCRSIREQTPLILNITNYVAMDLIANSLLAVGASPLMSSEPREMEDLVRLCRAVVINTGCIETGQLEAMNLAAATARTLGRPLVLDPAGAGASGFRTQAALELVAGFRPAIIRANASEVMALAGLNARSRGVDSAYASDFALNAAKELSRKYGLVVSLSGEIDYVTDGDEVVCLTNGSPLMPSVTAMGCTASALTGAFAAVDGDMMSAAVNAMALMGVAGEMAAAVSRGTGSLRTNFVDVLSNFDPLEVHEKIRTL